jgi:four helix bundle protein
MGKSVLRDKSYIFAIQVVRLAQFLQMNKKEFVLSKQLLRSGTAVGALIREAEFGQM